MINNSELNKNKVILRKIVGIFNTGDFSEVNSIFSSDYIDYQRPSGIDINGPEEFKQVVMRARKSLPNLNITTEDLIVEGDKAVARLQWHSTDSTGKKIDRETIDILRFKDGQVVEHWGAEAWSSKNNPSNQ